RWGAITGSSYTPSGRPHAYLYENGVMQDLNNLIDPSSGWELTDASINDSGEIAASGFSQGQTRATLLTPLPEPSTLMIFTLLGSISVIRRARISARYRSRGLA